GRGGMDTLDYSKRDNAGLTLNLSTTGSSQAIGGGSNLVLTSVDVENVQGTRLADNILGNSLNNILWGNDGDDVLVGSSGDHVLIGGNGDDMLVGDDGRDVMIGGWGADRIVGAAGDDIMIGGYTAYDTNVDALVAIRSEWTSAHTYADRIN